MEKSAEQAKTDILDEPYKGPGAVVTSLGYAFIDFKVALLGSLAVGVAAAMAFPTQTKQFLNNWKTSSAAWKQKPNTVTKVVGHILHKWHESGDWAIEHMPFKSSISKALGPRWEPTSAVAGMLSSFSFVATIFTSGSRGVHVAHQGRDQFAHAKSEIKDLRVENAKLRERFVESKLSQEAPSADPSDAPNADTLPTPDTIPPAPANTAPAPETPSALEQPKVKVDAATISDTTPLATAPQEPAKALS